MKKLNFLKIIISIIITAAVFTVVTACKIPFDEIESSSSDVEGVSALINFPKASASRSVASQSVGDQEIERIKFYLIETEQAGKTVYNKQHSAAEASVRISNLGTGPATFRVAALDADLRALASVEAGFELKPGTNRLPLVLEWNADENEFSLYFDAEVEIEIGIVKPPEKPDTPITYPSPETALGRPIRLLSGVNGTGEDVNYSANLFTIPSGRIKRQDESTGFSSYTRSVTTYETTLRSMQKASYSGISAGLGPMSFINGLGAKWGGSSSSSRSEEGHFFEFRTESVIEKDSILGGNSPFTWANMLNLNVVNDLLFLSTPSFLDKYDSHFITEAEYGVMVRINHIYRGSTFTDKNQVSGGFNAMINMASLGLDWSNSAEATEFISNSFSTFYIYGAHANYRDVHEVYAGYSSWFDRAILTPGYIGSPNMSYMAIWDVFFAYAALHPDKAAEIIPKAEALRTEFYERVFAKAMDLSWLTVHTRTYSAVGSDKFYLPATADGALRQVIIYAFGAGGGGGGSALVGGTIAQGFTRWHKPGGGGGGGSASRFGFSTRDDIILDLYTGRGGGAGGLRESPDTNANGHSGGSGEATWVKYGNVTMTAGGGQGAHQSGSRNGGAPGSASSNPGPQFNYYLRLDGNWGGSGGGSIGAGGNPVSIDNFSAGRGGNGGNTSSGSAGANGLVVICYYSLD